MNNYYEIVARLLVWKECRNIYWIRDASYNGVVIHRSQFTFQSSVFYPFPFELSTHDHLLIAMKRNRKGGGWKSLPKLLKYLDNKDDPDAWLKKQKLIKELLPIDGGTHKI